MWIRALPPFVSICLLFLWVPPSSADWQNTPMEKWMENNGYMTPSSDEQQFAFADYKQNGFVPDVELSALYMQHVVFQVPEDDKEFIPNFQAFKLHVGAGNADHALSVLKAVHQKLHDPDVHGHVDWKVVRSEYLPLVWDASQHSNLLGKFITIYTGTDRLLHAVLTKLSALTELNAMCLPSPGDLIVSPQRCPITTRYGVLSIGSRWCANTLLVLTEEGKCIDVASDAAVDCSSPVKKEFKTVKDPRGVSYRPHFVTWGPQSADGHIRAVPPDTKGPCNAFSSSSQKPKPMHIAPTPPETLTATPTAAPASSKRSTSKKARRFVDNAKRWFGL